MKKNYVLALAALVFAATSVNAQFTDDFESYSLGPYHGTHWGSWSGAPGNEDVVVSSIFEFDGTKSGLIGGSGTQDVMLNLGNKTSGVYELTFQAYIPTGKSGYMNFQGTLTADGGAGGDASAGIFNSPNLIFNNILSASGAPGMGGAYPNVDSAAPTYTWAYPQATWFPVVITFDLDAGEWTMNINGTSLAPQPFDDEVVLGGIDFFSFNANNQMFVDAFVFESTLSVDESSLNAFKSYPNPVKDILTLDSKTTVDMVEVYDILGQNILTITPNTLSPKVDMSSLASGTYLVKVTTGNQSKTVKVLK